MQRIGRKRTSTHGHHSQLRSSDFVMDLNQGNTNPQTPTSGSDSFVILAHGTTEINKTIKQFEANYILHSMSAIKTKSGTGHYLLFHKKNLSIVKELEELKKKVEKLIEITHELPHRI